MSDGEKNCFILAGNGPYTNRGCEAIVRGTVEILRSVFGEASFVSVGNFLSEKECRKQADAEIDPGITHKRSHFIYGAGRHAKPAWWAQAFLMRTMPSKGQPVVWQEMLPYLSEAKAVLSVGGDSYSLDYGVPRLFLGLNDFVLSRGKRLVLWGASIGPFDNRPAVEKSILENLARTVIFARETATIEYLNSRGLKDNVYRVADPAFVMKAQAPQREFLVEKESVGINLSLLISRPICGGDEAAWIKLAADLVARVAQSVKRPIYLIPHEMTAHSDDHQFLRKVASLLEGQSIDVTVVPPVYSAAEMKWIIGRMSVFAGARTHSTIAAISSGVPTLSIGYSRKAKGLNQDIFGGQEFCLQADQNLTPEVFAERMSDIFRRRAVIREQIQRILPEIQSLALEGGRLLKKVINDGKN